MVALVVESWIWYGIVLVVACSRFISRRMTLGTFKRYQLDDYVMMAVLCFYTTLIAVINIVRHTSSNLLPPGSNVDRLSHADIQERIYGSKLILAVEQCQCVSVWGAKACLIIMYLRLTVVRRENIAIKILAAYVAFGFVFMEIFYFAVWCRPFNQYWAVPTDSIQCDAATNHLITNAVFNLSSDCAMIAIGLPMFLRMQLPLKKKIPLVGIFSLGIFVILAAILNKWYSFTEPFGSRWTYWYVRESSTALLVANLPFVWAFWRRVTGTKTSVEGLSRRGSREASTVLTAEDKAPDRRKSSVRRTNTVLPWDIEAVIDSHEEVEMEQPSPVRTSRAMTLHDALRESTPDMTDQEQISPITHPSLFYSMAKPTRVEKPVAANCAPHVERGHRDGMQHTSTGDTPVSSLFPHSLNSRKSAGSFV